MIMKDELSGFLKSGNLKGYVEFSKDFVKHNEIYNAKFDKEYKALKLELKALRQVQIELKNNPNKFKKTSINQELKQKTSNDIEKVKDIEYNELRILSDNLDILKQNITIESIKKEEFSDSFSDF